MIRQVQSIIQKCCFIFFLMFSFPGSADLWRNHAQPSLTDGFDSTGIWIISSGVAATLVTQQYDYAFREAWSGYQRQSEQAANLGNLMGDGLFQFATVLPNFLINKEAGVAQAEGLVLAGTQVLVLKNIFKRARPDSDNHHSMPSGHSTMAFATAASISQFYGPWVGAIGITMGTFVALSRISSDAHWLSDTVMGGSLGYFWGRATAKHHKQVLEGTSNWILLPWFSSADSGLLFRGTF